MYGCHEALLERGWGKNQRSLFLLCAAISYMWSQRIKIDISNMESANISKAATVFYCFTKKKERQKRKRCFYAPFKGRTKHREMWTSTSFIYIFQTALVFEIKFVFKRLQNDTAAQMQDCVFLFCFVLFWICFLNSTPSYWCQHVEILESPVGTLLLLFFNNMRWNFSATPHRPWRKQIQLKSTWLNVFLYSLPTGPHPTPKKLTPHPGSARNRLPGQGHGRLRVLGAPLCLRWRTP